MTTLLIGNPNPQMQVTRNVLDDAGEVVGTERISVESYLNQAITRIELRDDVSDAEEVKRALSTDNDRLLSMIARQLGDESTYALAIRELESILDVHSAGSAPKWVSCPDEPELEQAVATFYGCARGEPVALLTTVGRDALHAQHLSTSAPPATFNFMALTANATAASAASTVLTAEIATAGGGLLRAQATYAHTGGTNTTTLTKTFTANGSDALPVTIAKIGVFNAVTVGTLAYETLLSASATLSASGDSVTVTHTITGG